MEKKDKFTTWLIILGVIFIFIWCLVEGTQLLALEKLVDYFINYRGLG